MPGLVFHIDADYQKVIKLREEIDRLKSTLSGMDGNTSPATLGAMEIQLAKNTKELDTLIVTAVKASNEMDQNFKKKIFDSSMTVNRLSEDILNTKEKIDEYAISVRRLSEYYKTLSKSSPNFNTIGTELADARKNLEAQRDRLRDLQIEQGRARLSVKSLKDEYTLFRKESAGIVDVTRQIEAAMGNMAKKVFSAVAIKEFVSQVVDVRAEMQSLNKSFEVLLGSKEKSDAYVKDIKDYALVSPLSVSDVSKAAQTLLGFNVEAEKTIPMIKSIGDISMGDSQKFGSLTLAFAQMSAAGRLMGQDLNQMINAGFNPLQVISEKTGKSITQLKKDMDSGAVSSQMVADAFASATAEGGKFYGMTEKSAEGIRTAQNQLTGAIEDTLNAIGESHEGIIKGSYEVATYLVKNYDTVGRVLVSLVGTYGAYRTAVITNIALTRSWAVAARADATAKGLQTVVTKAATIVTAAYNAVLKANPYVMVTTLVVGLATAMWALHDRTSAAEKAQKRFNDEQDKFTQKEKDRKQKVEELIRIIQDETETLLEKIKAYEELERYSPALTSAYKLEELATLDLAKSQKILNEERDKADYDNLIKKSEESRKRLQTLRSENGKLLGISPSTGIPLTANNDAAIKAEEELLKKYQKSIDDIQKKKSELNTGNSGTKVLSSISDEISNATKKIATLKQELSDLRSGKTSAEAGKTVQQTIEDKVKELQTAESALATLTGKDKSSLKEASDRLKTKQDQSDLLLEISRNAKERENAERQTAFEIEQAKIDIKKDGFVKEQAQIELNHQKALQGITLRGQEMLKAQQDAERKQWEKDGKKGVFTPKTTSVSQLPTEQLQLLADLMNGVVAKTNNDSQTLIDGMVKQYQTYAEKRKEIEKKFDDDIRSMQEKNTDGKYDANIKEAGKQRTEALAEIDSTVVANKNMWTHLFADTSAMSKKQIKQILSDIKNLTDYLEGISVTIPVGFTQEQLEQLKKDPEKIKAIYDELIKKQDELDDRTNYPFSGIIKGFGKLKEAAELAEKATKATTEEERKALDYQAESAKAKGMDYIREGAVMASDSVSMLADKLKELAAATGDERFSESAEQFGALAQNLGAAAKGFQSGGWIGAIIGGATDMLTQTFQAITTAKAEVKEFEENRKDFLAEYNLLLLKNRISSEDQDNVFGTSALKRASEAAKAAQDAMAQYTDEVTKRTIPEIKKEFNSLGAGIFGLGLDGFLGGNFLGFGKRISEETKTLQEAYEKGYTNLQAMAVKTKDRSVWANFWGKKDEYTSLYDLTEGKLWDKETGDFDIEAAKTFLETNTQINDEQRKQIEKVIGLKEAYEDAMQVLKDDVADTFGSLGTGLMDSIVGAVQNGDIAMEKFADSVGKTFENLGKKIAQELFFQKEFDKLQEDLVKTYELGDSEAIANAQMDIVSRFFDSIGGKMDEAEAWMEEWKKKAAEKGFTLWGEGESDWLGTTTDSIAQSILDGLEAGKSGIADFADDFESLMKKAVLNSIKMKYLEEPLKEFYKKFASFSESGGQLTEVEIEELRGMYGDIVDGAKAQFDNLKDIAGLDFTSDSENSLKGAYAKASQESITLIAGQFGRFGVVLEDIKNQMQPFSEQIRLIQEMNREGWQDVRAIRDLTVKIDKNSEQVAENTRQIKEVADKVADNTKRTADTLEGRIDVNIKGM